MLLRLYSDAGLQRGTVWRLAATLVASIAVDGRCEKSFFFFNLTILFDESRFFCRVSIFVFSRIEASVAHRVAWIDALQQTMVDAGLLAGVEDDDNDNNNDDNDNDPVGNDEDFDAVQRRRARWLSSLLDEIANE